MVARGRQRALGVQAAGHVRAGDHAGQIIQLAEERDADLIVTGTRGLGGIARLLLGSVARNVLTHARCSVLIMRNGAPETPNEEREP